METAGDVFPDWSRLPQELLVTVFCELEIFDLLRSGAVCTSWHFAYSTFRRLRLPSPKQSPCLFYSCESSGPDAAALYSPSTGSTFRIPTPGAHLRTLSLIGSADGWIVAADEIGDLHLLNPLTGGRAALPPVAAMHHVEVSSDEEGGLVYNVDERMFDRPGSPIPIPALEARDCMYFRAVLSCGPSAGAACVVLLLHMPNGELSYARPGDERWTWVSPDDRTGLRWRNRYRHAAYNKNDGLFYVVRTDESVQTLDLNGPLPVVRTILRERDYLSDLADRYLVHAPWGDLLHVWRYRINVQSETPEGLPVLMDSDDFFSDPLSELITTDIQLYKTDFHGQKLESMKSLGDHALFLGYNSSMCLPIKDFPGLKPNRAYITDDFFEFINCFRNNKREVGVWNIEDHNVESLGDAFNWEDPWLNWPVPIWITPSLL